ncbi:DEAD/DEAH box helicase [archaeon]|jgi:ATP-dependent RNA helicase RhlE|nr:DEAD/DEAH box helicase [archaeon]MBT4351185.1 DEAD/DEAH box helicase [archaeon]MBT4646797.1 DEAD/DEAH box helicase [archaeon]MBT6821473.1 DEAD/DEAH box helicase [archaeon]MBT7392955.1 DEAD/DEAH box helicase [archaeon]
MIFDELAERIKWALIKENFSVPTSIQEKAIPIILKGKDLIGIAQTGTGKTASFVLPILHLLSINIKSIKPKSPLVLVLSPTRELAMQIDKTFEMFGKHLKIKHTAIFGGVSQEPQIKILSKGIQVLTATPGRLLDLISHDKVNLSSVEYIVLDEAHMMLDMGFLTTVKEIYKQVSKKKQSLFFCATITPEILKLANELLNDPSTVKIEAQKASNLISQKVCYLYIDKKNALLLELIKKTGKTIVFLRTKYKTDVVAKLLIKNNISAASIHSDKNQEERTKVIENFKSGKTKVLVATDIAARGIHIDNVSCVINYNTPNYPDVYVNRIGRTARAGKLGVSYTFCGLEERESIKKIEEYTSLKMEVVHHTYYASKVENATPDDIVASVKKKCTHKFVAKKSKKKSEFYVPPINQKKSKRPRGVHARKGTKKLKKHNKKRK